jgi:hypothetical protein
MARKTPAKGEDKFLIAYGEALRRWSYLEVQLAVWFRKIALIPSWDAACAIFFSARSFQGRADMFAAALDTCPADPAHEAFLRDAHLKIVAYNNIRNQIAHGIVHPSNEGPSITRGERFMQPGEIKIEHLQAAGENFRALYGIIHHAHDAFKADAPPEQLRELHEQLRLLPNEACSSGLSRKQQGRERQRQAALRNKSKPQAQ